MRSNYAKQSFSGDGNMTDKKKIRQLRLAYVGAGLLTIGIHVLLLCLRTEENHSLMLLLNILVDVLAGWSLLACTELVYMPRLRLYRLFQMPTLCIEGEVLDVCHTLQRVNGLDCYSVSVDGRSCFVPETLPFDFKTGDGVRIYLASNTVAKVERL